MRWFDDQTRAGKILLLFERKIVFEPKELAEKLSVSTRTIKNEINQLNKQLGMSARIENKKNRYRLYIFDMDTYSQIRDLITQPIKNFDNPNNRIAYISDVLLSETDYILIDDLAFDIDVSRTTLNNDLKELKKKLSNYSIQIEGKTNTGIRIKGNEYQIRKFILENIYSYLYNSALLDSDVKEEINKVFNKNQFEKSTVQLIEQYLVLALDRFLNGNPIQFESDIFLALKDEPYFKVSEQLSTILKNKLGIDLPLEEKLFLTLPMVGMRTPVDTSSIEDYIQIGDEEIKLVDRILREIREDTEIDFQFDDTLDEFIYHLVFLNNRLKYQINLYNPIKDEIRTKYPLAWSIAKKTSEIIEQENGLAVNDYEVSFLTSYFEVMLQTYVQKYQKEMHILLIHLKGGATKRLITYQLEKILGSNAQIEVTSKTKFTEEELEEFDLILTTDKIDLKTSIPIIELDEVIDEKLLKHQIERISYIHGLQGNSSQLEKSVFLHFIDDTKIKHFDPSKEYELVLKALSLSLLKNDLVDEDFYERLMERERLSSMEFSNKLAFPHTTHRANDKPAIILGLAPNGLKDKPELRVIILAALPENVTDDLTLVQLYEEIVKITENDKAVDDLAGLSNYLDILDYFLIQNPIFEE